MTTETRLEADSIGTMEVPAEAYYGVQALRAKQNFPITGTKLHPAFIRNLAQIKKAAAITNNNGIYRRCHSGWCRNQRKYEYE